jgi:NADH:ubiquinone oxidoreductase subunit 5 (subunit L)/multisubunit Na+/H+ antiporter MnhA subunit
MKPATIAYSGLGGLSSFLLLGHLFAEYPDLRNGVTKVVLLIVAGVGVLGGINLLLYCAKRDRLKPGELRQPLMGTAITCGAMVAIVLFLMMVGGA